MSNIWCEMTNIAIDWLALAAWTLWAILWGLTCSRHKPKNGNRVTLAVLIAGPVAWAVILLIVILQTLDWFAGWVLGARRKIE